jgi:hypothetical protein
LFESEFCINDQSGHFSDFGEFVSENVCAGGVVLGVSINNSCENGFVSLAESFGGLVELLNLQFNSSDGEV